MILKELDPVLKYHITNRPDNVAQSVERRASIPEIVGSIPTQPSVVFTQSSTLRSYTPEYNNAFTS